MRPMRVIRKSVDSPDSIQWCIGDFKRPVEQTLLHVLVSSNGVASDVRENRRYLQWNSLN